MGVTQCVSWENDDCGFAACYHFASRFSVFHWKSVDRLIKLFLHADWLIFDLLTKQNHLDVVEHEEESNSVCTSSIAKEEHLKL